MGSLLSCLCCGCCPKKQNKEINIRKKKTDKQTKGSLFKNNDNENSPTNEELISKEKFAEEQRQSFRAGESAYAKQSLKVITKKIKDISESQYNRKGLVDESSREFQIIKHFLKTKNYDLISSIGSGNFAEVYKAYSERTKKFVAVKVIQLTPQNSRYREKFLPREVEILQECKHPNIIKMYELNQTKNKVYMIMEFAPNGTLADWLKNFGALTESTAHSMLTKTLEAIHHLHTRRIAHRDIKLENILIDSKLQPKISDFSFAVKVSANKPMSKTHCGSLPYFAPELLQKKPYNPLISDIWSLGVCFYIMLNDGLPFKLGDDRKMLTKQLNRDWNFKTKVDAQISPELKSMIRKMLDPNTKTRITAVQLMEDPWINNFADKY